VEQEGRQIRPWVRYWARFIDIYLWFMLCNFIIEALQLNINIPNMAAALVLGISVIILIFMLWTLLEALMLAKLGYTPGKWLFRIAVTRHDGQRLSYREAFRRAIQVLLFGEGLYIPIVSFITNIISYNRLKSMGITLWDERGGLKVSHREVGTVRTVVSILIILALFWVNRQ
jgi:uncharacterized RDD family membrane protein YckC